MLKRLVSLAPLMLALSGCFVFPNTPTSSIGALLEDGEIHLLFNMCPNEALKYVDVRTSSNDLSVETAILWQVEANAGQELSEVVIGEAPPEFEETVPLGDTDLLELEAFGVRADMGFGEVSTSVIPEELEEAVVVLEGHRYSREEFFALDCSF